EANRGINKRGFRYVSYCTDEPCHSEEKESLYGAHNFILIDDGNKKFGMFIDNPGSVTFDIGFEKRNQIVITPKYMDMCVYMIYGEQLKDIVKRFRQLIGRSYIPPKWAFGFGQSRWSYETAEKVNEVIDGYLDNDMLISSVYMDIDYMEDYKDFTVSKERFPEFKKYVKEVRDKGIRLVPIIDAGVKIEPGYSVYEEGVENDYFVKDVDGNDYVTAVWPGLTHFPDFLNWEAREWFGNYYKVLLNDGIEGFWNDMNEPAIFYSQNKVDEIKEQIIQMDENTEDEKILDLRWQFNELANNPQDYAAMYHNMDGKLINHDKVHNLYGYNMTRAAGEAFERIEPNKRILMFSRSSYIGMHRYSGIWMGDNCSWWSHILLNLKMLPSLNMCGFLYVGADVGGFGSNASEDLVMRWMALGVFTPLLRNHSALGTRNQECYNFTATKDFKNILDVRYRLLPYLYSEYMKAVLRDEMMFKPLAFEYEHDEMAAEVEDQLMLGDDIMIAPVYTQNATGRYVYLPEDMTFIKFVRDGQIKKQQLTQGVHYVEIDLHEIPLFIKKGHKIPVVKKSIIEDKQLRTKIMECSLNYQQQDFEYIGTPNSDYQYELYQDDGISRILPSKQDETNKETCR
ncbi:MAG: alpha-glucosidase, partial [Lachnospiraceae bacterium]|nr:alpha-glucosidase [Lachnospiraceae bacterium]